MNPLHLAIAQARLIDVIFLLRKGVNVNARDNDGWSPLHVAVGKKHLHIVNILLAEGADPNMTGLENETPLHTAVACGNFNIVKALIMKGANLQLKNDAMQTAIDLTNQDDIRTLLMQAAGIVQDKITNDDRVTVVDERVQPVIEIKIEDTMHKQCFPLHDAVISRDYELIEKMLGDGVFVDSKDTLSCTPLHMACARGFYEIVSYLLLKQANVHAITLYGDTPLHYAAFNKNAAIIVLLLKFGANPNVQNQDGILPVDLVGLTKLKLLFGESIDKPLCEIDSSLIFVDSPPLLIKEENSVEMNFTSSPVGAIDVSPDGNEIADDEIPVEDTVKEDNANNNRDVNSEGTSLHKIKTAHKNDDLPSSSSAIIARRGTRNSSHDIPTRNASFMDINEEIDTQVMNTGVGGDQDDYNDSREARKMQYLMIQFAQMEADQAHIRESRKKEKGKEVSLIPGRASISTIVSKKTTETQKSSRLIKPPLQANKIQSLWDARKEKSIMHQVARFGRLASIDRALASCDNLDLNALDKHGKTVLHICAEDNKRISIAQRFVQLGADVNFTGTRGITPLQLAIHFGQIKMVEFFQKHGAVDYGVFPGENPFLTDVSEPGLFTLFFLKKYIYIYIYIYILYCIIIHTNTTDILIYIFTYH